MARLGAGGHSALGIGLVIAACTSYGSAVNLARPLQQRNGAWRWSGGRCSWPILTAPLACRGAERPLHATAVLSLLALGALGTGVANVLTTMASGRLGRPRASASAFFIPAAALLLGALVRNEHVALLSLAGGAISLPAARVVRWATIRAAAPRPPWPPAPPCRRNRRAARPRPFFFFFLR